MKKKILLIIIIALIAIGFRFVTSSIGGMMKQKARLNVAPPNVVVQQIEENNVIRTFDAPGRVVSKYQVSIMARISGYLQKSFFKEGDYVKAGETLFLIEPAEYQNASNVAGANIQNIKAQLAYANKQLARAEELVRQDYIAKAKYDEILANRDALKAQLSAAQSNYKDTNRNLSYTRVKAPVDGRIGIIDVTVGNYVTPSSGSLTTINSTNPIYVTFPLSSEDYAAISSIDKKADARRKVELFFQNGDKYELNGVQDFLDNKVDQTTGTVTLRATFQNPNNKLLHGEFVNVRLFANNPVKVPVVPIVAVQENQEGKYVYTIDNKGLPKLTYIKTQGQSGDNWIVKDGLKYGDKVIVEGILKVTPGSPVKIVSKEQMEVIKAKKQTSKKSNK
ncbi:MAG: efflux RND transporter periplasmic adaptor subunit [Candidatus Gastranaerophilaceae bacterium]|jgi:efflux transporter, RND family, MFP subunit|nr:efflux transporter RND family MFP subunit [Fusobacterium sp. CAG:815]DAA89799.1 MAG TPA: efflux RND transporter periplasmic adaptor subunit [Candidatus Gastranaerophilales bacterium HUM_6]DAA91534.1 MAG TPA: efflux RND transporter periplasmic adaptor subunit [Candidatus Gastranaerophilales bacterium HUM_7]DAB01521.1 MAG TPA: efflux RND transporter periplasmic adaptor subunit [Candidatus Gastranaerophilales bacterium HUM_12]DAB05134.1 MAG TPA: efflux RND transporter periplasmic adaptor subuni